MGKEKVSLYSCLSHLALLRFLLVQHWLLITTAQCNTLVARCSRQLIGPADWVLPHRDPYAVISLEAVAFSSYCNTVEWFWWD